MARKLSQPLTLLVAALVWASPSPSFSRLASPDDACVIAAEDAALETGVPRDILLALTLTETGRANSAGKIAPWAWALNQGGESFWFDSQEDAVAHLETALAQGRLNIDVGCFQLNYRWHGAEFPTLEAMLDPTQNARYAAGFVAGHFRQTGDWLAAVAAYHSATPELSDRYIQRFEPMLAVVAGMALPRHEMHPKAGPSFHSEDRLRRNGYPLLQSGGQAGAGSLVPQGASGQPLIGW